MTSGPIALLTAHMANWRDSGEPRWIRYFEPVPELSTDMPIPILGIMVLIWQLRDKDLQPRYPLSTYDSKMDFLAWCAVSGAGEYASLNQAELFWEALSAPAEFSEMTLGDDDAGHALSWYMVLIGRARRDLNIDIKSEIGRRDLLIWYLMHGCSEMAGRTRILEGWQVDYLNEPSAISGLNRLQAMIYHVRADVRAAFPLPVELENYLRWYDDFLARNLGLQHAFLGKLEIPSDAAEIEHCRQIVGTTTGANLIGYAYGQLGIGEDVRMAAKALQAADVPFSMLNFSPGADVPQADFSMAQFVQTEAKYSTNIFCLTALEHGRFFAERGAIAIQDKYNIGYWPWELAAWPEQWEHLLALVDEVWVSSKHTFDSLAPIAAIPIKLMPMAVALDGISSHGREFFGLPPNARLFLFAFDLNSSANRKNPQACVDAFQKAFPKEDSSAEVALVIKVHPPRHPNKAWERLKSLRDSDSRIFLIEETLQKEDLLALYRVCDCFVSLHRAEGFGRGIAEVMLLKRPVIVTAYSGNLQFNFPENSLLVKHHLAPLEEGDYPYGEGQVWAHADIEHAAIRMRQIALDPCLMERTAYLGRQTILQYHSPDVVGENYLQQLSAIVAHRTSGQPE